MFVLLETVTAQTTSNSSDMITQGVAASAVIAVVVIFLAFLKEERKENREGRAADAAQNEKERERHSRDSQSERELFRASLAQIVTGHERVMQPIVDELKELRDDTVRIEGKIDRLSDRKAS